MKRNAQITIEFLMLLGLAFAIVMTFLAVTFAIYKADNEQKAYDDIIDLGNSLQQEFLLAAQLEDGYTREINVPYTLNSLQYNISIGQYSASNSVLILAYDNQDTEYIIPKLSGNITLGDNILRKINNTLVLN